MGICRKISSIPPLNPEIDAKRRRLFEIARCGSTLLEIGVNGGHSMLLAKSANPDLKCVGIDICRQIDPTWGRVDVYVPTAMNWLQNRFPDSFKFMVGDSRLEAPRFAVENPNAVIDILHVDGAKDTYFRDIINLRPVLSYKSLIVIDDSDLGPVKKCIRHLMRIGFAEMHPDFPAQTEQKYQHVVMRIR